MADTINTVIATQLTLDAEPAAQTVKSFKAQLKEATLEVITMSEKFGETSVQATAAAKKAALLKDAIGDAKRLTEAFDPDAKFKGVTQALGGVAGGFAAIQGSMALLGVESEDVAKSLLKVQAATALASGLNAIGDSIDSMKNLGKTILNTLGTGGVIGIAVAGVAVLGLALAGVFDKAEKFSKEQLADIAIENKAAEGYGKAAVAVAEMKTQFELARKGLLSKQEVLKTYNEGIGQTTGQTKSLAQAEQLLIDNAPAYITLLNLKAKAQAAGELAAASAKKALQDENKDAKDFVSNWDRFWSNDPTKQRVNAKNAALKEDNENTDLYLKKQNDLLTEAAEVAKKSKLNFSGVVAPPVTTKVEEIKVKKTIDFNELQKTTADIANEAAESDAQVKAAAEKRANAHLDILTAGYKSYAASTAAIDIGISQDQQAQAAARANIAQGEADARLALAAFVANQLSIFSELAGKQTAAGKVLAIASATISTYLAAAKALAGDYTIYGPAAPFVRIATVVSTIALGLKQVASIVKVQVPGGGGAAAGGGSGGSGGGGGGAASFAPAAPIAPQAQVATTQLDQQSLNAVGNAATPVRAFVVEHDVTNNQERITRLNRAARLGG